MSMTDEHLEILIGRSLDGEITPDEQRRLDDILRQSQDARELLEQLRQFRDVSLQAVKTDVLEPGRRSEEILQRVWQRRRASSWRELLFADRHLRFVAGLAAGFALGLLVHVALVCGNDNGAGQQTASSPVARETGLEKALTGDAEREAPRRYPASVIRNVDWYGFTDRSGQQWLVEGVREGAVRPAVYYGDL